MWYFQEHGTPEHPGTPPRKPGTPPRKPGTPPRNQEHLTICL